ncbi:hypothetical protein [Aliikangiella sp. IMCC44359]|uniref:hypothetical protein n=1 Tax=Aliikangiella sp. IMCC44359 TaxID=3459125 RepID=UPI00403B13D0
MERITFKMFTKGSTEWVSNGAQITSEENLSKIERVLESIGSIIVEHWHFYGSRAPDREIFDDYEDFIEYLNENAVAGDAVHIWSMHEVCTDGNELIYGKCPNDEGLTPKGGAY